MSMLIILLVATGSLFEITKAEVPLDCKENEVYSECGLDGCLKYYCSDLDLPPLCRDGPCTPRCECKEGLLRASFDNDTCVPIEQCERKCKDNEQLSDCPLSTCQPQTCKEVGRSVPCPVLGPNGECPGEPGCICSYGFLRDDSGKCIPKEKCPKTCPEGEVFADCPVKCAAEYCPKSRNDPQTCPTPKKCGPPGCVCGFNSHRDRKTKKCIATAKCPPFPCRGPHEKYQSCPPVCPGESCSDYLRNATCPKFRIGYVVPCKPACRCNKGYYRNAKGVCVSSKKCKSSTTSVVSTEPQNQETCTDVEAQQRALEEGNTAFTGKFFYEVVKNNPESSVIMSPFSVLNPLGILALYSKGQTNQELMSALNLKTQNDIRCAFPGLLDSIKASNGTELDAGSKIYVYKQGQLSKSLQDDSEKVFHAEAESLDFSNPDNASDVINQWVSDATKGKITKITSPDMFDDLTRLVIANALYFKGFWKYAFDPQNTKLSDFYVNSNTTIQVPTMYQKGQFQYSELSDPDVQILELPYQDEDITFLVVLPKDKNGLLSVVEKMQDPEVLRNISNNLSKQTVSIFLPKIAKISTRANLADVLPAIGIRTVFDPSKAVLSGMVDTYEPLYVSQAVQEATFTADENGSEAAAATVIGVNALSATIEEPKEYVFNADHPFALYINLNRILTLFCGTFYG